MSSVASQESTELLLRAAGRAALAPSVHNTQPWHLTVRPTSLELHAESVRRLHVLDPTGRQLMISCGCALLNARVALALGRQLLVDRLPDPEDTELVARITLTDAPAEWTALTRLDLEIEQRRTNRREFDETEVGADVVAELVDAAGQEEATLIPITAAEHRSLVAELSQEADARQASDPRYQEELRSWTTTDLDRLDGVPAMVVPQAEPGTPAEVPLRSFDTEGKGWLPTVEHSSSQQCLLLLTTSQDTPLAWVRAGEALERLWLEATRLGCAVTPMTQVIEVADTRQRLRDGLGLTSFPQVLLRVGHAAPTPATPRRKLNVVLSQADN